MVDEAAETPLPTTVPPTLNASSKEYRSTWCPTGFTPSMTDLNKRRDYLVWKHGLEEEARQEVQADWPKYKKDRDARQRAEAPKDVDGKPLW